jgi:tetratricopeptide (TPR) repeat protein
MQILAGLSRKKLDSRNRLTGCVVACLLLLLTSAVGSAQEDTQSSTTQARSIDTPEAHLGAGYEFLKSNRFEAASHEFQVALGLNPKLVLQARFPLAVSLFELHRLKEARHELEAVRREAGDHPNLDYYLGRLELAEERPDAAILELSKAAARPPFPDTAYYLGCAYLKRHDLALAEKWLRQAAELLPRDSAVQYRLGLLYSETGRKGEAQRAFSRSEQLRQREADTDRLRLDCTQKLEHDSLAEARPFCERLFDPDDAEKLTMLGTIYGQHGYYQDALRPLLRAAELSPNAPQMQYNVAYDYFQLHQYRAAREPVVKAVERWPDLYPLNALLGAVLLELGEQRPAYEALRHAHELNPQDAGTTGSLYEVALGLAGESLAAKQYDVSLRYSTEAATLRPREPEPHRLLAEIYNVTGRQAEAAQEQRQVQRLTASSSANRN